MWIVVAVVVVAGLGAAAYFVFGGDSDGTAAETTTVATDGTAAEPTTVVTARPSSGARSASSTVSPAWVPRKCSG